MKKIIIISFLAFYTLTVFCQSDTRKLLNGVWTEKENGTSEIKWTFHSNGMFNNVSFWSNPVQVGGLYRLGKFSLDEKTSTLNLAFEKTFTATNETAETHESKDKKEWLINSISEDEIIIRRPVLWESEKKYKSFDGNTVQIRLKKMRSQIQDVNQVGATSALAQ